MFSSRTGWRKSTSRRLLTGYAAPGWAHELDLASLERARDVFVAEDLRERR